MRYNLIPWILLLFSCKHKETPLFALLPADETGIYFQNNLTHTDTFNIINFRYFYNGGGVAIGDVNRDGQPDIYFSGNMVSSRLYLNQTDLKFKDITDEASVNTQGWSTGVSMVDINQDGWLDIYVCVSGSHQSSLRKNLLFINQGINQAGIPTFTEQASDYGLDDDGYTTHAAFFDYDKDHDLDVYLLTAANGDFYGNTIRGKAVEGQGITTDRLYRNEGPGANGHPVFKDVSREAGILLEGFGLGINVTDINDDNWPDIYVSNDYLSNDLLYINHQHDLGQYRQFTDLIGDFINYQSYFAMGNDVADINNDGLPDLLTLDMLPAHRHERMMMINPMNYDRFQMARQKGYAPQYMRNTLQLNRGLGPDGKAKFSEIGQLAGIHQTDWSWSPLIADFDNDGFKDIHITNGYVKDITNYDFVVYSMHEAQQIFNPTVREEKVAEIYSNLSGLKRSNYIYRNNGDLTFSDKSKSWGLSRPSFSNGAAYADLDNDGDLDIVVNNINDFAFIYENKTNHIQKEGHYLRIKLMPSDRIPLVQGSKIRIEHQGKLQFYEHYIYRGYQSTVESIAHFGLGQDTLIDKIVVTWPDGAEQTLKGVKSDQTIEISYKPTSPRNQQKKAAIPVWSEVSGKRNIRHQHRENNFVDFKIQPLLPHMYSKAGPGIAVGDMNGDGLEDFFTGGAFKQRGACFYQRKDGTFARQPFPDSTYEDMGALLFDADLDNDLDLYVVSGGGAFPPSAEHYQDRLYINEGIDSQGYVNFRHNPQALPDITASGSCVTAADYDRDGDLDLFIGGKVTPHQYPLPPRSYLLNNENGVFKEVTPEGMRLLGMVNTALWTDFNQDGWVDLVIAGEWMPIMFFKNNKGALTPCTTCEVEQASREKDQKAFSGQAPSGWWNSIAGADFDHDGDLDYIVGNLGLNSYYKASVREPLTIYAKDFDDNGSLDAIISAYQKNEGGKMEEYPIHTRDEMVSQIVNIRRRFPRYEAYASATMDQVLTPEERKGAYQATATNFATNYLENLGADENGNTRFLIKQLPIEVQFAPVFGLLIEDVNQDDHLDVLLTGNSYASQVQTGHYDALWGVYLKGDGKGNFTPANLSESGFFVKGDGKALARIQMADGKELILASRNSGTLLAFEKSLDTVSTTIKPVPFDHKAEVIWMDGRKQVMEFYYGSGYLSQSSRLLNLRKENIRSVALYTFSGKKRLINLR